MKKIFFVLLAVSLCWGCSKTTPDDSDDDNTDATTLTVDLSVVDESSLGLTTDPSFTDPSETEDSEDGDRVENSTFSHSVTIAYSGTSATVTSLCDGVTADISGGDVTITSTVAEIEYVLSGTATDGSFKLYSTKKYKLTLNGVSLTNSDGPAINIQSSKKGFIVLPDGTTNTLSDGTTYATAPNDEDQKGCLFSEGQIIFSGTGQLSLSGNRKHAICTDDYFKIRTGSTINITSAKSDGIHANDSIIVAGGKLVIVSAGDGIQCEDGGVTILGGTSIITTSGEKSHGITSCTDINISDGAVKVTTTGNGSKGLKTDYNISITGGNIMTICQGNAFYDTDDSDITSCCGIKADSNINIAGAKIVAYSSGTGGKGISCDGTFDTDSSEITVMTKGKKFTYGNDDTSAKGIKAEGNLTINSGTIKVQTLGGEGSEGIESKSILSIKGGTIDVVSYDDCINAASAINISGGKIYCYSTNNDGMDSNGTFSFSGGLTVVSGTLAPEEGFDCDQNNFAITGGILVGFGSTTSTPTTASCSQNSLIYNGSGTANAIINLSSSDGTSLFTCAIPRTYSQMAILFSAPEFANGSYILYSGGSVSGAEAFHFYAKGGTYSGGSKLESFTSKTIVTTVGTSTGGNPGGGGPGGR